MGAGLRGRAASAMVLALVTLAGCTDARPNTSQTSPPNTPTSTPSSPSPDPQASATAEVLAAYLGFWEAATEARAHPNRRHPRLAKYAIDKALAAEQATIVLYRQQGIVGRGEPKLNPKVIALATNRDPATALIRDCVDVSNVEAFYRDSGQSALAPSKTFRHIATAKATIFDGRWVIREITTDRKQPC